MAETAAAAPTAETPLLRLASGLAGPSKDLLAERKAVGDKVAQRYEQAATEGQEAITDVATTSKAQAAERAAARPATPKLAPPPSTAPRAFLEPGASVLSQMQGVLMGIGLLGMQAKGLRGSAIAATTALKGAYEGWMAGDRDRVERELTQWKASTDTLLHQHKLQREAYEDILVDHKMTMDEKLRAIELRAKITGNLALAESARAQNLDVQLQHIEHAQKIETDLAKAAAQIEHWRTQQANIDRAYQATQAQRAITNRLREATLAEQGKTRDALLRQRTLKELEPFQKAGKLADGLNELEKIYTTLEREHPNLVPKSGEVFDAWSARLQRALKPGDTSLFQMKMLWNQVIVGLLDRGWSDEKGVRSLAVFQSQINVQDQLPPPAALHTVMKSIRGLVRSGIGRDMTAREKLGASAEEMALARMFTETLRDPAESETLDEMGALFK